MTGRNFLTGLCAVALAGAIAFGSATAETTATGAGEGQAVPRPVVSTIIRAGIQGAQTTYYGQVAARVVTALGFAQGGELAERPVSEGDMVAAGAVVARLDPTDLEARLRAAEAGSAAAEAQLRQAADAEARLTALVGRGSASSVQLEGATLARAAAEAAVNQAAAALASAKDLRDTAQLVAPDAGVILATYAEPGANLSPGQPVVQLAGLSGREVLIDLTEAELARIGPDARFHVTLDANPAITAEATVVSVDPVAERATRTRRAHLGLINPPDFFRIGALARATPAALPDEPAVITLPATAVLTEDDARFVWRIARPTGQVSRVQVQTAAGPGGQLIIVEGLTEGDEVLIKGIHSVTEGEIVGPQVSR